VDGNGLRSRDKILDLLARHVSAEFRAREFTTIRRSEIVALLDHIEDDHGAPQADLVLGIIRRTMFWYASRVDDYTPPSFAACSAPNRSHASGFSTTARFARCGRSRARAEPTGRWCSCCCSPGSASARC